MKIVHVIGEYLPEVVGGTQLHVRDLCRAQRRRGHRPQVFTRCAGQEHDEYHLGRRDWDGIPVTSITYNFRDCDRFERIFSHPRIDGGFRRFLRQETPDLVHVHHLSGLSVSMIEVAKARGCQVVATLHDYWFQCPRGQRIYPDDLTVCETLDRDKCLRCLRQLVPHLLPSPAGDRLASGDPELAKIHAWESDVRRWLGLCDATIAPSDFHRRRFVDWGLPRRRCAVIAHGLPKATLLTEPRDRPVRHVGYVGAVIPTKGIHVLVEAFNLLDRRDLVLDVHGAPAPFPGWPAYQEELEAMVRPGSTVRFHGRYEPGDLPRVLAGLDLLVVPSLWWESFCLTAREGALAGLPVIASRIGGLEEAVEQGLALGFEAGDAPQLAGWIDRLCRDRELRATMSRRADRVRDFEQCAADVEAIYDAVRTREVATCN